MGSWEAAQREEQHCLPFTLLPSGSPALGQQHHSLQAVWAVLLELLLTAGMKMDCRGKGRDPKNPAAGPSFGNQTAMPQRPPFTMAKLIKLSLVIILELI